MYRIKLDLLDLAVQMRPEPTSVFCVFDDEYFHREVILIYEEQEKEAA